MNSPSKLRLVVQRCGLVLGPLVAALLYAVLPAEYESAAGGVVKFSATGHATLALMLWMAIWWLTEAVEITTATLVPVLAALAPGLEIHPYVLIFPAAIAASCAFMLPIATPPNAIVFGSGRITIPQMAKAGLWLNLIAVGLITALTFAVIMPLFGGLAGS